MKIAEFIRTLTSELRAAASDTESSGNERILKLRGVELELTIQVDDENARDGGIDLQVISASKSGKVNSSSLQKVKVCLDAVENKSEDPVNPPLGTRFSN